MGVISDRVFSGGIDSPIGKLVVRAGEEGIVGIDFEREGRGELGEGPGSELVQRAIEELEAYFAGELLVFDLPLVLEGTPFQIEVWKELQRIPYGETISYGELAQRIGNPDAVRAVGAANGRNRIPIIIPCHRVIGGNGTLTGYAGGIHIKQALLALERKHHTPPGMQLSLL